MFIRIKDISKLLVISIIICCAVFVCTMFLNFYFDIVSIEDQIIEETAIIFYNAQVLTAKVVCLITGICLFLTSLVVLFFYIKHYIDSHKKELGILKALGYSSIRIAKSFWVFGLSILVGALVGFLGAFLIMPKFYELQNEKAVFPDLTINFHFSIVIYFILLPTLIFSLLAILYAYFNLKKPVLSLLKEDAFIVDKVKVKKKESKKSYHFLNTLKRKTLSGKKVLVFFIILSSFCFSSMTQMSFSMKDLSSEMMGLIMLLIGIILAFTILFLAIITVINGNKKTIALMKAFGYTQKECFNSTLGIYRPLAYIGFFIGTVYQYVLLRIMVDIVFKDIEGVPEYKFDYLMMFVSLIIFTIVYEFLMYYYSRSIEKITIKEIMLE